MKPIQFGKRISTITGTDFNLITNRAASAIHLALTTFSPRGIILIPSNICLSPIMAGKIANYEIRFVGTREFQPDLMEIVEHLQSDKNINAMLLPELYGYPIADLENFWNYIKERDILVVEDLAQTLGKSRYSHFRGRPTIVTIYSFGPTKIIDSVRCGILSTNNENFFRELESKFSWLENNSREAFVAASENYNTLYKALLSKEETDRDWPNFYIAASKLSPVLYTPRFALEDISSGFINNVAEITQTRNERHRRFLEVLRGNEQIVLPLAQDSIHPIWRTTIRVDHQKRELVVQELRNRGFPVSTWYKAMHVMLREDPQESTDSLEEAVRFQNEVINLFLDIPNFEDYFKVVRNVIKERLS